MKPTGDTAGILRASWVGLPRSVLCRALVVGAAIGLFSVHEEVAFADDQPVPTGQTNAPVGVPKVSVSAPAPAAAPGSAEAGYLVTDTTAAGPILGDINLQDAPYSINVISAQLIDNLQVYDIQDALKYIPSVQAGNNTQNSATGTSSIVIRGFYSGTGAGSSSLTVDGLVGQGPQFFPALEDMDRLEVLGGVSGFLYGIGQVGGVVNEVLKRPTATPLAEIDLGDNMGANFYVHGDFGGPIPGTNGVLGYRLNVVESDGNTSIEGQSIRRNLQSGALDIHLTENLLLQLNGSHAYYALDGETPSYILSGANAPINFPPAPNPSTIQAVPWIREGDTTYVGGVGLTWTPNDVITLRSRWQFMNETWLPFALDYAYIADAQGDMGMRILGGYTGGTDLTHSGYTFIDIHAEPFGIQNKFTIGVSGFYEESEQGDYSTNLPANTVSGASYGLFGNYYTLGNFYHQNLINYTSGGTAVTTSPAVGFVEGRSLETNYVIADEIKLTPKLVLLAGGNYARVSNIYYAAPDSEYSNYNSTALTPSVGLTYKVYPWLSTYANYQQSLQPGTTVVNGDGFDDGTIYTNNGAVLPPYRGTQYEIGTKATLGQNLLATLALFTIDTANLYTLANADGTFTELEGGSILDRGIELTATGKVTEALALYGGMTWLDARIHNNPESPDQDGQFAQDASHFTFRLYSEYTMPPLQTALWLHGLTLTAGYSHYSPYYGYLFDPALRDRFPGYDTGDLGFRYAVDAHGHPITLRFTVTNVANSAYYVSEGSLSMPRTYLASLQFKW